MRRVLAALSAAAALAATSPAWSEEPLLLAQRTVLLEQELELAKDSRNYFVFDFEEAAITLKVKGIPLRVFPLLHVRWWGEVPPILPLAIEAKDALMRPERPELKPDVPETAAKPALATKPVTSADAPATPSAPPELEALELRDMPTSFTVVLAGDLRLEFESEVSGRMAKLARWLRWKVGRPLATLREMRSGKPTTRAQLRLAADDVRALYWSMPEESRVLIFRPVGP